MPTEKSRIAEQIPEQEPVSAGALNFNVELGSLQEAEAIMDRLQEKYQALGTTSSADQMLLGHMSAMLERSRLAPAGELPDLTSAMIQAWEALVGVE